MLLGRSGWFWPVVGLLGVTACLTVSPSWVAVAARRSPLPAPTTVQLRRPVAVAFLAGGSTLCVANQRSGTLSLVDLSGPRVRGEVAVGQHLTGLAALPGGKHLLVVDDERHQLVALAFDGTTLTVRARLAVGPYPASVAVQPDGKHATVASLWSRRVEVIDLSSLASPGAVTLRVQHTIRLPFAPHSQCILPIGSQVVVADAFAGHLAVVDSAKGNLVAVHRIRGHNLRGLSLSADGKRLLVSHQILDEKAPTTQKNLQRGTLMDNALRSIPIDRLTIPRADLNASSQLIRLGTVGAGAGDPAGIALVEGEQTAVALAGVNEVALVGAEGKKIRRIGVGRRPTAVAGTKKHPLVVVNTFDDSLSLLDVGRGTVARTLPLGPHPKLGYKERGELLFYDARLSRDGWMSCHSCHTGGHTNGLLADTLGDGTYGTPKRTLTLLGTRLTDPWGWNGKQRYLFDQVRQSLAETMYDPSLTEDHVGDLTSFLTTLPPPPPLEPVGADKKDREQVERGRRFFEKQGCTRCHIPPLTYSTHEVHDVGLSDERGLRRFNPPSLRGVGQGYRFLHDNRAATLEEVFTRYHHKVGRDTPRSDIDDLVRFLRSL
jgi:DNA-binding beta-propeller fold protein YncE